MTKLTKLLPIALLLAGCGKWDKKPPNVADKIADKILHKKAFVCNGGYQCDLEDFTWDQQNVGSQETFQDMRDHCHFIYIQFEDEDVPHLVKRVFKQSKFTGEGTCVIFRKAPQPFRLKLPNEAIGWTFYGGTFRDEVQK